MQQVAGSAHAEPFDGAHDGQVDVQAFIVDHFRASGGIGNERGIRTGGAG